MANTAKWKPSFWWIDDEIVTCVINYHSPKVNYFANRLNQTTDYKMIHSWFSETYEVTHLKNAISTTYNLVINTSENCMIRNYQITADEIAIVDHELLIDGQPVFGKGVNQNVLTLSSKVRDNLTENNKIKDLTMADKDTHRTYYELTKQVSNVCSIGEGIDEEGPGLEMMPGKKMEIKVKITNIPNEGWKTQDSNIYLIMHLTKYIGYE